MDIGLLKKLFGAEQQWHGPCTVILDGEVTVQAVGADAIGTGGAKFFAPRTISGRVAADSVCLIKDGTAVVILQVQRSKTATGEEQVKQTIFVTDPQFVVAVEFFDGVVNTLQSIGLSLPTAKIPGSHSGYHGRPKPIG
jgi:hypothetical protein